MTQRNIERRSSRTPRLSHPTSILSSALELVNGSSETEVEAGILSGAVRVPKRVELNVSLLGQ